MTIIRNITREITNPITQGLVFTDGLTIKLMIAGDSIGAGTSTGQPAIDYVGALATYNITATIEDASQGGKKLIGDFVNVTFDGIGAEYTDEITNNTNVGDVTDMVICLGTNDIGEVAAGTYTKANFKTSLEFLVDYMFSDNDLASLERIYIRPLGRETVQSSLGFQTGMESIRQCHYEVADEKANVYILPPYYALDYADSVHPTPASYTSIVENESAQIAFINSLAGSNNAGMEITSAEVVSDGINLTISHGLGTDFTVPTSGDGIEATRIFNGSDEYGFVDYERVDATTLKINSGAPYTGTPDVRTIYGSLYDLGVTSVPMVKDNSDFSLPMRAQTVTATNTLGVTDKVLAMGKLHTDLNPAYDKTLSGSEVTSIRSVNGSTLVGDLVGLDFDSSAHNSNGGFKGSGLTSALTTKGVNAWTAGSDVVTGITVTCPTSVAGFFAYLSYGRLGENGGWGDSNAKLNGFTDEALYGYNDGGEVFLPVAPAGTCSNVTLFVIHEVDSTNQTYTWRTSSGGSGTITRTKPPTWSSVTDIFFGGRGNSEGIDSNHTMGRCFVALGREVGDPTTSDLLDYLESSQGY